MSEFLIYRPAPRGRWDSKPVTPVASSPCGPIEAKTHAEATRYAKVVWGEQAFCVPKEEVSK